MKKVIISEKYSALIRSTHWVNVPVLFIMIWSGILIYWANDVYIPFFPKWFYDLIGASHHLALGMAVHFLFMWFFALNGLIYVLYLGISGEWKELIPTARDFAQFPRVILHDIGLLAKSPPQQGKLNSAQKLIYTGVISMGFFSILTGLAIYKPVQLGFITSFLGGYENARLFHFGLTLGYVVFMVLHVTQVVRAGWNNFRAMIAGYEIKEGKFSK